MEDKLTFVIDIDDTIFTYPVKDYKTIQHKYSSAKVNNELRETINRLYSKGHVIILHTGRNWDKYKFTKRQLADFNINHHELVMGKPQGIYIDKHSYHSFKQFFNKAGNTSQYYKDFLDV
jgi:hydroxymethylpyrimidine pyrophosphatase-like HAD family hydrolase